jgi:manganese/zinc/iron transport system permease protein
MLQEIIASQYNWQPWDTAIVVTGAVAAMSCALPGVWLVLRRQSMMGDALSHTALPGVVIAFLFAHWLRSSEWVSETMSAGMQPLLLFAGAVLLGVLTAVLTEWVQHLGRVESGAALGVVFTSLFALGLLLIRLKADNVHIDLDCVLFGQLELVVWETVPLFGSHVPLAVLTNAGVLGVNLLLLGLFFKELRISTFDPELATSLGINARVVNYLLMAATAVTVVMAFESVGSILVIGLLIVPAATAALLADRLGTTILLALVIAALSAGLGHLLAKTLPPLLFAPLGFTEVRDAGSAGMIAVACGLFFVSAFLFSPRHGLIGKGIARLRFSLQIAADDVLAILYRFEEQARQAGDLDSSAPSGGVSGTATGEVRGLAPWIGPWLWRITLWRLRRQGLIRSGSVVDAETGTEPAGSTDRLHLTDAGRSRAGMLVRSHRLWESYMQKHFTLPEDHLHESAHYVEHFLDRDLSSQLEEELDSPQTDPHGRTIPDQRE